MTNETKVEKLHAIIEKLEGYVEYLLKYRCPVYKTFEQKQFESEISALKVGLNEQSQRPEVTLSDEEIEKRATEGEVKHPTLKYYEGFIDGAKWARNKMK